MKPQNSLSDSERNPPVPWHVILQEGEARAHGSERALHMIFAARACFLSFIHACKVTGDAGSVEVRKDAVLNSVRLFEYDLKKKSKPWEKKADVRMTGLNTPVG